MITRSKLSKRNESSSFDDDEMSQAFQNLNNVRSGIYKNLSDLDTIFMKCNQLVEEVNQEVINAKHKSNILKNTRSSSKSPHKAGAVNSTDAAHVVCFQSRRHHDNKADRQGRRKSNNIIDVDVPDLF